jgi:DNA-binding LacI/PurR family transcriptional regulator
VKRPTIADVANRAGVSKSTVSYALSNKRSISETTRLRIQQAIDELGYHPNATAKRLASGEKSRNIGFVLSLTLPEITTTDMRFIAGATKVLNQADYTFILLAYPDRKPEKLLHFANSGLVDGFILLEVGMQDSRVDALKQSGVPFVLVGRCEDNEGITYVDQNFAHLFDQCVKHLAKEGHKSIAYLHSHDTEVGFTVRTKREFRAACERKGVESVTYPCELTPEAGKKTIDSLLDRHPNITAAIIWSDIPTLGVIEGLQARGIRSPEDFAIICQEHSVISTLSSFAPSIIDIRADELTSYAAQMLIDILEGKPVAQPQLLIPPKLILGEK